MLVTPIFKAIPADLLRILSSIGRAGSSQPLRLAEGIYEINHWNFDEYLHNAERYPQIVDYTHSNYISCDGVCDNYQQILNRCPEIQTIKNRYFVISMVPIIRDLESPQGGWRWHKWGDYIGTQNPQHEYIYDDKHIDKVFTFGIFELSKEGVLEEI